MLAVNAEGPEIRVAVVEDGALAEFFVERKRDRGLVGNIYRGKVTRVLPGMQAAFVDLGPKVERAAFLYVADVLGSGEERRLFEDASVDDDTDDGDEAPEGAASRFARSRKQLAARKIEDLLKPGQTVLCQVVKDPIGQKGARVTGYLSLPGRYSVFMPHVAQIGVSRRIGSDKERRRLRDLVNEVRPKGSGFIVRTAAEDASDQELRDDVDFLARLWSEIDRRQEHMSGAGLVYADLDLALRVVRDLLREDTSEVMIDDEEQHERVKKFTLAFLPRFAERIKRYEGRRPIFDHYHIEPALRQAVSRRVPLRSGGSLVIDQGEALTAIDINTGSFTNTGSGNLEDTVTANNLEACEEVARQLRLRNIGGIIVVDFVDMDKEGNRRKVWDAFHKALSRDRARTNVTKISELGLVEMTRKRTRESLVQLLTEPCPTCEGSGVVKSVTTVAYEILREVRRSGMLVDTDKIEIECAPRVADVLSKQERDYLDHLEKRFQKLITVSGQKGWKPDQFRVAGKMSTEIAAEAEALSKNGNAQKAAGGSSGGGGGDRGGRGGSSSGGRGGSSGGGGGGDSGSGSGGRGKRRRRGGRGRDRADADA
ncbi:MAG TPA: Rne/Rng family ribonuclease [Kofleriaceae bacterium]|nr:Rne/Rng family ribonuclease [Kofleriaceae bacterium]